MKHLVVLSLLLLNVFKAYEIADLQNDAVIFEHYDHGTPDTIGDCTRFQTDESSCCYFSYGSKVGCVMLGKRYLGTGEYGGLTITCESCLIRSNILVVLVMTLVYILL